MACFVALSESSILRAINSRRVRWFIVNYIPYHTIKALQVWVGYLHHLRTTSNCPHSLGSYCRKRTKQNITAALLPRSQSLQFLRIASRPVANMKKHCFFPIRNGCFSYEVVFPNLLHCCFTDSLANAEILKLFRQVAALVLNHRESALSKQNMLNHQQWVSFVLRYVWSRLFYSWLSCLKPDQLFI